jgi:hypothetical protein
LSSINIPGIQPANISYLPIPGQDLAIPINPDEHNNSRLALKNLLPSTIVNLPLGPGASMMAPPPPPMGPGSIMPLPNMPHIGQLNEDGTLKNVSNFSMNDPHKTGL